MTIHFAKNRADRILSEKWKAHSLFSADALQFYTVGFIRSIVRIMYRNNMKFSEAWIYRISSVSRAIFIDYCYMRITIFDKADILYNEINKRACVRLLNSLCSWGGIAYLGPAIARVFQRRKWTNVCDTFFLQRPPIVTILYRGVIACNFIGTINFDLAR